MSEQAFNPNPAPAPTTPAATHSLAARLQAVAMILIMLVGLGEGVAALTGAKGRQRLADNSSVAAFFSGRMAGAVNYVMAHDLPSGNALSMAGGIFRWRLFGAGGPQVSPGCTNWLFLTEELRPWPGADAAMASRADAMRRVADRMRQQHIALVFALVPDKARVEAAQLCGVRRAAQEQGRYQGFLGMVRARGLPIVDLLQTYAAQPDPEPLFYRTDTHWSLLGSAVAAKAIAASVPAGLVTPDHPYVIATDPNLTKRAGDLLRLMSLDHVPDFRLVPLRPFPDLEHAETITPQPGTPAADSGGLLDAAPALQVILLGSSYSLNGNFLGHLEQAFGTQVGQFGEAGGAFSGAARTYFANAAYKETPPKLIIWEIPERVVGQPANADEQAFLDGSDKSGIAKQ